MDREMRNRIAALFEERGVSGTEIRWSDDSDAQIFVVPVEHYERIRADPTIGPAIAALCPGQKIGIVRFHDAWVDGGAIRLVRPPRDG